MSDLPHIEDGPVLAGVKATPSGWPAASLDPGSGRDPGAVSGSPLHTIQQIQVSTLSGDCRHHHSSGSPARAQAADPHTGPEMQRCPETPVNGVSGHRKLGNHWI